jgi:protein involved in polysaccharide export with SLBB domain
MEGGEGRPLWQPLRTPWLGWVLGLLAGCASVTDHFDRALMADQRPPADPAGAEDPYTVACPDVIQITVEDRPDAGGRLTVGADGCVGLGAAVRLRVEGLSTREITCRVSGQLGVPAGDVQVTVAEYNSRQVFLAGQIMGLQRSVPYHGPETILDLLQRVGGITRGAAPDDVYVVRSRLAEGKQPEVFHVNLRAVVLQHDSRTNLRLQPFDQVFVGESRGSCLKKCVPPILRPVYDLVCGLGRDPA